jgi:hypothetical protein
VSTWFSRSMTFALPFMHALLSREEIVNDGGCPAAGRGASGTYAAALLGQPAHGVARHGAVWGRSAAIATTSSLQQPQSVPARVLAMTSSRLAPAARASRRARSETAWQEQTIIASTPYGRG